MWDRQSDAQGRYFSFSSCQSLLYNLDYIFSGSYKSVWLHFCVSVTIINGLSINLKEYALTLKEEKTFFRKNIKDNSKFNIIINWKINDYLELVDTTRNIFHFFWRRRFEQNFKSYIFKQTNKKSVYSLRNNFQLITFSVIKVYSCYINYYVGNWKQIMKIYFILKWKCWNISLTWQLV